MADIWSGNLVFSDDTEIKDITIASQNVASLPVLPAGSLHFVATVETARIPLYLATGPSLDVWTKSEATEEWFSSLLSSKALAAPNTTLEDPALEWWSYARAQSPISILAQFQNEEANTSLPRITEILFFGTVTVPAQAGLPTPPSSSPEIAHITPESLPELRLHALPISSDLLYQVSLPEIPPLSPTLSVADRQLEIESQFLPYAYDPQPRPSSPKRRRDIFDEATQARKKARGKGGEGIAAAAAKAQESQRSFGHRKSLSIDTSLVALPASRPSSAHSILGRPPSRQLSPSPSIVSDSRPLSRKGVSDSHAKRSTLSQVATVSLQPEEPTTESRNKEALSRVVMAAMRMHGLQQRKKNKSRRASVAPGLGTAEQLSEAAAAEEAARDEEYKLIYHQTFKGAALALRKHIATRPLHSQPDKLRDVVERLLAIFCTDPLTQPIARDGTADLLATPGSKQLGIPGSAHSHASPFDLPSGSRIAAMKSVTEATLSTGSPISRKKATGIQAPPE